MLRDPAKEGKDVDETETQRNYGYEKPGARVSRAEQRDSAPGPGREWDVGVGEARRRFGGLDIPATLVGTLVALALAVLLGGLVAAAVGAIGYQTGLEDNQTELSIGALAGGFLTLFLSFLLGGWAAGRMARYDGGKNGLMTGVWAILLAAVLAGLGAWLGAEYNVFRNVGLPRWFSRDALTVSAIVTGIGSIAVMLLAGFLGGKWGERYHRRADATIVATREGGLSSGRHEASRWTAE